MIKSLINSFYFLLLMWPFALSAEPYNSVIIRKETPFDKQLISNNCIYIIKDCFDLGGKTVHLPRKSILSFSGGTIQNGELIGNLTTIDAPLYPIFSNVNMHGSWCVDRLFPEWFGAVGDGKTDDTKAFRNAIRNAFNNHITLSLASSNYSLCGDNPFGVEYIKKESDISFFHKEGLKGDDNRSRYNYYVNGNGALINWTPNSETDVFCFVGYIKNSVIENINIHCRQEPEQYWGDIFSTRFHVKNHSHIFSNNIIRNIRVSGGCRRVFSFDSSSDEKQTHDDLSLFEKITASNYRVFCYISNGNAVSNTFSNCTTNLCVDGSVDFFIDCPSWAGNLRINDHHFTISNCKNAIMIKDDSKIVNDRIIYVNMPRVEIHNSAGFWKYFDISGISLYVNGLESITNPHYDKSNEYATIRTTNAQATISDVSNLFQPFAVFGGEDIPYRPSLTFNNCTFRVGQDYKQTQDHPQIIFKGHNCDYETWAEAYLSAQEFFPYVRVNHCHLGRCRYYESLLWEEGYYIGKQNEPEIHRVLFSENKIRNRKSEYFDESFVVPYDVIITSIKCYCQKKPLSKISLRTDIIDIFLSPFYDKKYNLNGFQYDEQPIYLPEGSTITISLKAPPANSHENDLSDVFWGEIEYRRPVTKADYQSIVQISQQKKACVFHIEEIR